MCALQIFLLIKGTLFLARNPLLLFFLATGGQRLPGGWSYWGSNPGPSDSQPDAMTTWAQRSRNKVFIFLKNLKL